MTFPEGEKPQYDNTNTGVLFKKTSQAGKVYWSGRIDIEGKITQLVAYPRVSKKNGSEFLKLEVKKDQPLPF